MGPLQLTVTWYKIHFAGDAVGHPKQRKFKSDWMKLVCFGRLPVRGLLSRMADSVTCDRLLQRVHWIQNLPAEATETSGF